MAQGKRSPALELH